MAASQPNPLKTALPYILAIATTFVWAGNALIARALQADIPPVGLAFWRWTLAVAIFLPFAAGPLWRDRFIIKDNFWMLFLMSVPGIACYNTFVYVALQTTQVANTTMTVCAAPALILIFMRLFFGEKISTRALVGIILSFSGVVYLLTEGNLASLSDFSFGEGELWALAAALAWSLYSVLLKKRPPEIGQRSFVLFTFIMGALILLPFAIYEHNYVTAFPVTTNSVLAVFYVAILASILAYIMWNRAISLAGPNKIGVFLYLFPVFASLGAAIFLGERLEAYHGVGVVLVIGGIYLLLKKNTQPKPSYQ